MKIRQPHFWNFQTILSKRDVGVDYVCGATKFLTTFRQKNQQK